MSIGDSESTRELNDRLQSMSINEASHLIYTSGTTGQPKGVMLSHDTVTYTVMKSQIYFGVERFNCKFLSFLPLSHVAANMMEIYTPLMRYRIGLIL